MVPLSGGGWLVDTPGFSEVGLWGLEARGLAECFPEMRLLLGHCRFQDCRHVSEPGCAIRTRRNGTGAIHPDRYASYLLLLRRPRKSRGTGNGRARAADGGAAALARCGGTATAASRGGPRRGCHLPAGLPRRTFAIRRSQHRGGWLRTEYFDAVRNHLASARPAYAWVLPVTDTDVRGLAHRAGEPWVAAILPAVPAPAIIAALLDKSAMDAHLARAGLRVPRSVAVSSTAELVAFGADAGWPVMLKPSDGVGGGGVVLVQGADHASGAIEAVRSSHPTLIGAGVRAWRSGVLPGGVCARSADGVDDVVQASHLAGPLRTGHDDWGCPDSGRGARGHVAGTGARLPRRPVRRPDHRLPQRGTGGHRGERAARRCHEPRSPCRSGFRVGAAAISCPGRHLRPWRRGRVDGIPGGSFRRTWCAASRSATCGRRLRACVPVRWPTCRGPIRQSSGAPSGT